MRSFLAAVLAAGCSSSHHAAPDAAPDADLLHCPAPVDPTAPGTHTVFVNFDGVTLTKGNCNDATTNCTSLVVQDQTVVPPWLDGNADRANDIAAIMTVARTAVAPYSIDLVTTRPASGDYKMIVVGG